MDLNNNFLKFGENLRGRNVEENSKISTKLHFLIQRGTQVQFTRHNINIDRIDNFLKLSENLRGRKSISGPRLMKIYLQKGKIFFNGAFLTFINNYTKPTFVQSLDTIGAKLRLLERVIVFSLEDSIAAPIDSTQLIYELNLYLYKTYICTKFGDNWIKITTLIVHLLFLFVGKYYHFCLGHIVNFHTNIVS